MQQLHVKQTLTEKMTQSKMTHHTITTLFQYCKCRTRQKIYLTNISWEKHCKQLDFTFVCHYHHNREKIHMNILRLHDKKHYTRITNIHTIQQLWPKKFKVHPFLLYNCTNMYRPLHVEVHTGPYRYILKYWQTIMTKYKF